MSDLSSMDFLMGTQSAPVETTTVVEQAPNAVSQVTKSVSASPNPAEQSIRGMLERPEIGEAMLLSLMSDAAGINMSDITQAININQMLNPRASSRPEMTMQQAMANLNNYRSNVLQRFNMANPAWFAGEGQLPFMQLVTDDPESLSQTDQSNLQQYIEGVIDHASMSSPEAQYYKQFLPAQMQNFSEFNTQAPSLPPSLQEKMDALGIPSLVIPNLYRSNQGQSNPADFIRQMMGNPPTQSGQPVFQDPMNINR